jgi:hypothetical protein
MTRDWMDGLPFIFSIAIKLASSIPDEFYTNTLIRDIPASYTLNDDQKKTIAAQALDGNERIVFIVTMLGTMLSAAAICLKKEHQDLFIILLLVLVTSATLGILKINSFPLGYLETRVTKRNIRRSTFVTVALIALDVTLGAMSVFLHSPADVHPAGG